MEYHAGLTHYRASRDSMRRRRVAMRRSKFNDDVKFRYAMSPYNEQSRLSKFRNGYVYHPGGCWQSHYERVKARLINSIACTHDDEQTDNILIRLLMGHTAGGRVVRIVSERKLVIRGLCVNPMLFHDGVHWQTCVRRLKQCDYVARVPPLAITRQAHSGSQLSIGDQEITFLIPITHFSLSPRY